MLIISGHPVAVSLHHVLVEYEALVNVDIMSDLSVVNDDAEGPISALDRRITVAEGKLGDEAAWPGLLVQGGLCLNQSLWVLDG